MRIYSLQIKLCVTATIHTKEKIEYQLKDNESEKKIDSKSFLMN